MSSTALHVSGPPEPGTPSFFATLSTWWIATILVLALLLTGVLAKEAAHSIDQGNIASAEETMSVISALAKDMNRSKPHEFVARMLETGQFNRIGVYCMMMDANFDGTPERINKGATPHPLAATTMNTQSAVSEFGNGEIRLSQPLYGRDGAMNGALYMIVDRAQPGEVIRSLLSDLSIAVLVIVAVVMAGAVMLARKVSRPVAALTASTSMIANGALDTEICSEGPAELQRLSRSVASMVTNLKGKMREINRLAFVDTVTSLPNRAGFLRRGGETVREARADAGTAVGVLFIDLDGFKMINDTHGHDMGDKVLHYFARQLDATLRPGDSIVGAHDPDLLVEDQPDALSARLGGDEFTVLLTGIKTVDGALAVARRVLGIVSGSFEIDGIDLTLGVSIGVAVADADQADFETLLTQADMAMYDVKRAGKNNYKLFDPSEAESAAETAEDASPDSEPLLLAG